MFCGDSMPYIHTAHSGQDIFAYVIAAVIGIVLCLWGLQLSRFISSITFASVLGYITYVYSYKAFGSIALSILLLLIAIAIGFVMGFIFFRASLSIVFGYTVASIILRGFEKRGDLALLIILIIIFAVLIYVISNYLLAALFAFTGASLIYKSLVSLGLSAAPSIAIAVAVAVAGLYNQLRHRL